MTSPGEYCFQQVNTIHLFPLHKGDIKICSPEKSHVSEYECFIPPGQRFGEFCQMKSIQNYYFGTSLELSLLTWNAVI